MSDSRSFVDTNILVYAHDASAGEKRDRARSEDLNRDQRFGKIVVRNPFTSS